MINDETKRAVKKCLQDNGFDATIIDELIIERKTLFDEFYIAAMRTIYDTLRGQTKYESFANNCYLLAEAMMKRREKG